MSHVTASLGSLLRAAQWSPRQLVTAVNVRLSSQGQESYRLDPTAGYSWVKRGYCPRPPIPDAVAAVLSERLGQLVTAAALWPDKAGSDEVESVSANFDAFVSTDDLLHGLAELTVTTAAPGHGLVEASGADLTAAVSDPRRIEARLSRSHRGRESISEQQVELLAAHVTALRRLDDRHGGGALSLRYVGAELRSVIDLVGYASYDRAVGTRLMMIVADLAQLLGWLQFDSGRYAAAERYLLFSVEVARSFGAVDRAANAIGMLAYVSAFAGHGREATRLADAALSECASPAPVLQARLLGREATAAAADGDLGRFRRASETAMQTLLDQRHPSGTPTFLYYLAPHQLEAETGQALVVLAERTTARRRPLLDEAVDALRGAITGLDQRADGQQRPSYPRSAMVHSTFLAKAQLLRGDLEQGVQATRYALGCLDEVQSPRGRAYLRALRPVLARRSRAGVVAELLPEFDQALSLV